MASEFNSALTRLKSAIRRRGTTSDVVSAVDVSNVMRTRVNGASRGAVVRRAFLDLVEDGTLTLTSDTVYNPDTHHQVSVYRFL